MRNLMSLHLNVNNTPINNETDLQSNVNMSQHQCIYIPRFKKITVTKTKEKIQTRKSL